MKYQELMNEAKQFWDKQKNGHFDADDVEWITVNGAHIPLNDEGKAMAGGDLKGEDFSKAKSEESGSKSGKNESKSGKAEQKSEPKAKNGNAKAKKMSDSIKNAFEDQDFEELSIAVEDAMKEMPVGSVMNFNGSKHMATLFDREQRYNDKAKVLMVAFYIDLSGVKHSPFVDRALICMMKSAVKKSGMDTYQFRELYLDAVRTDITPRHIMSVSDSLYLLELALEGRDHEVGTIIDGFRLANGVK